jgi:hypothetical protein
MRSLLQNLLHKLPAERAARLERQLPNRGACANDARAAGTKREDVRTDESQRILERKECVVLVSLCHDDIAIGVQNRDLRTTVKT